MPYHILVVPERSIDKRVVFDKEAKWIEESIVAPRREGRDIFFGGRLYSWNDIREIHIYYTGQSSQVILNEYNDRINKKYRDQAPYHRVSNAFDLIHDEEVTERFISGPPGAPPIVEPPVTHSPKQQVARRGITFVQNRKAVMVIYGHDSEANKALFAWLRAIGLQPKEWGQLIHLSGSASPYIGQVLEHAFRNVQAVVAFFTPDEYVRERDTRHGMSISWRLQARPNVLIEAGMALVTHPSRTVLVTLGLQELPTDLAGRHYIRLDGTTRPLHDLASRLHDAGCDTDLTGSDWLDVMRFPLRNSIPDSPL